MQPQPNIDELLTGLLDGNLSEVEVRQVEAAMEADSTLKKRLETLRKMRTELLVHRPRGRLGANFAKRVIAMAEERARTDSAPTTVAVQPSKLRLAPWIYSGALSAAVIACILVMMPSDEKKQPLIAVSDVPKIIQAETPSALPNVGPLETQLKVIEPLVAKGMVQEPNSAFKIKEFEQSNSLAGVLPPSQNDGAQKKDFVVSPNPGANPETPKVVSKAKVNRDNEQIKNEDRAKLDASILGENFYTMVIDVSLTKDAIDNRTLESILSRHNIASTEEEILTPEALSNLQKTGLAGKTVGDGMGEVGLVFIRAPATNIYKAVIEVNQDELSFPELRLGMQIDSSLKLLVKELSSIRVVAESSGEARNLRSHATDSHMPFAAGSKKLPPMKRKAGNSGMSAVLKAESRAMSNALWIIRPSK